MKVLMPTNRAVATSQVTAHDPNICCHSVIEEKCDKHLNYFCINWPNLLQDMLTFFRKTCSEWQATLLQTAKYSHYKWVQVQMKQPASRSIIPPSKSPSLYLLCVKLKQVALCKVHFTLEVGAGLTGILWQCQWYGAGILTLLFCLTPALLSMGELDSKNDGHSQLVPIAGQGAAALQLLALGPEGISFFPPTSAIWSASPFPATQNNLFTVMFTTAVPVFWTFLLHRNMAVIP